MAETRTASEIADAKLHEWESDERASQMESDGRARRRYREIISRTAAVVELNQLVEAAMRPPALSNREVVENGLLHDYHGRQRLRRSRPCLSRREAERTVRHERPDLAAFADAAVEKAESDGSDLAQIQAELTISTECVGDHAERIVAYRQQARLHARCDQTRRRRDEADAACEAARQALQIAELTLSHAKGHQDECTRAHYTMSSIESDCPILFEGVHDYGLPPEPSPKNGKPARRERGLAWVGGLFRRT